MFEWFIWSSNLFFLVIVQASHEYSFVNNLLSCFIIKAVLQHCMSSNLDRAFSLYSEMLAVMFKEQCMQRSRSALCPHVQCVTSHSNSQQDKSGLARVWGRWGRSAALGTLSWSKSLILLRVSRREPPPLTHTHTHISWGYEKLHVSSKSRSTLFIWTSPSTADHWCHCINII